MVITFNDNGEGGNVIGVPGASLGCAVDCVPQNQGGARPELYNFGHESDGEIVYNDIHGSYEEGCTLEEILNYTNTHGGRTVLEKIKLKSGSFFS